MPDAQCTRSLACKNRKHASKSPRSHRDHPAFPHAMVLTAYFVLSPVIGLSCHRRPCDAKHHHELDAGVEASGPHDFAVRVSAVRPRKMFALSCFRVHRIPCPTFVTIAKRPSVLGRDNERYRSDLGLEGIGIFLQGGLDRQSTDLPVGHREPTATCWPAAPTQTAKSDCRGRLGNIQVFGYATPPIPPSMWSADGVYGLTNYIPKETT
jgi:hypothetical protein